MSGWTQMFYVGTDNGLWTRSLDPGGTWSSEAPVGGKLTSEPAAAMIPGTDTLQLFYRGADNALWTRWSDSHHYWSDEVRMGSFLNGNPVAAVLPGTDILQLFYRGADGALWTRWRESGGENWSDEQRLGGVLNGDPVAAVIPGTDILQLFYQGADGALWTRWRNPGANPSWSKEQSLGGMLIGNPVAAAPVVAVSSASWMAQLPDDSELSQLTLPGTHESCTAFLIEGASCQNWDLGTQLQHGIRYVDIRCRQIQDVFAIHHGNIYVGFNFGEGVRDVCVDFLKANPTECIVMQIKSHEDTDADNSLTFQQVFDRYVQGFESFFYLDDHIPTLGEARGKIVVIRRFDVDSPGTVRGLWPRPWQDNATFDAPYTASDSKPFTFHIQDQYNLNTETAGDKWPPVKGLLDRAKADTSDAWYINFASGAGDFALLFPDAVAKVVNPQLYDYLGGAPFPARLGTLMLDFADDNMVVRIIRLNTNT